MCWKFIVCGRKRLVISINEVERRLQLQAIYEEIEKSPVSEKVRKYFKEKPYQLRRGKEVNNGENRYIHKKQD